VTRALVLAALLAGTARLGGAGPLVDLLMSRQARVDVVFARSKGELPAADKRQLEDVLTGTLAFGEMARDALGAEWERRSDAERKTFADAFEALLRASLLRRPSIYRVERVTYAEEKAEPASGSVHTIVHTGDATTEVDYRFRKLDGEWRIVDYSVDGVSTVRNYRSQFAKILARQGWDELLQRIRRRTAAIQSGR
jgi:phospholipid transport system substrate-binding protein